MAGIDRACALVFPRTTAILLPIAFLLVALWICLEALQVPIGSFRMPGAGLFPLLLGLFLGVLALVFLMTNLFGTTTGATLFNSSRREIFSLVAAMFASVWLFERAGYLFTMALFLGVMMKVLRKTSWMMAVVVALLGSISSYVVFGHVLKIALPAGILPF
jgi:putative tricarboxylic transport membrane protein